MTNAASPAKSYNRWKMALGLTGWLLQLAFFALLLIGGDNGLSARMARWAADRGGGPWIHVALYLMLLGVLNELAFFGLTAYRSYGLERRFGLACESFGGWLKDHLKALALNALLMLALVEILYAFLRAAPQWWWVGCAAVFSALFIALARLAPTLIFPLFFKFTPITEGELRERLLRLAERHGVEVSGLFEMDMSRKTRAANAALAGMGRSRRIILADTLTRKFTPEEIEVVIAHEMGHQKHGHLMKGMIVQTVAIFLYLGLVHAVGGRLAGALRFEGLQDVAALPLLAIVVSLLGALLMPPVNALLRHFERQADRFAIDATQRPEAFVSTMRRLASMNLADPAPHPWIEALFHSHPSIRRRISFCEAVAGRAQAAPAPEAAP